MYSTAYELSKNFKCANTCQINALKAIGEIYEKVGNVKKAIKVYKKILDDYKTDNNWDRSTIQLRLAALKERTESMEWLNKYTDLYSKLPEELRLLRNEIYARHGYVFKSQDLNEYFEKQSWYKENPQFTENRLSEKEKYLKEKIINLEKAIENYKREEFRPYDGKMVLSLNEKEPDGMYERDAFSKMRIQKIEKYKQLKLFPTDYDPFKYPQNKIYSSITFGTGWMLEPVYYIYNPYLLIVLSPIGRTQAYEEYCGLKEITYNKGVIEETYVDQQAKKFFKLLNLEKDYDQAIRLWMVNAQDAGFMYITVDKKQCKNIDFNWRNAPENIANSIYSKEAIYHVGHYGLNNIGHDCQLATLRIKDLNKETVICIKLWVNKPTTKDDKEDLAYIIRVKP
jgi:hypothetical protein